MPRLLLLEHVPRTILVIVRGDDQDVFGSIPVHNRFRQRCVLDGVRALRELDDVILGDTSCRQVAFEVRGVGLMGGVEMISVSTGQQYLPASAAGVFIQSQLATFPGDAVQLAVFRVGRSQNDDETAHT